MLRNSALFPSDIVGSRRNTGKAGLRTEIVLYGALIP